MLPIILAISLAGATPGAHVPPGASYPDAVFAAAKTGKERLTDKGSDEQRVDDCKVPVKQRTRARPEDCAWDAGH